MRPASAALARAVAEGRREARALLLLGGPVIGAQLAQISMSTVDAVMAGRLSPNDLAAVALGGSLWMPVIVFGMGMLMSISPIVAHDFGAGDYRAIGLHVRQGLWLSQIVSLASFLAIRSATPALGWFKVEASIIPTAVGYVHAVSWGLPAFSAFTVLRCYSEAVSMTRPILWVSLAGLVCNIVGNYVFMYGHLGLPRLGAVGCGVATALTLWLMLAGLALWIARHSYFHRFGAFARFEWPDRAGLWRLVRLGGPIGFSLLMEGGLFAAVALLLGRFGPEVVAGHQIALNVASITFMVPLGVATAVTVRVGQACGARDLNAARRSAVVGSILAVCFMSLAATVMALLPRSIASIYTSDAAVQSVAAVLLVMAAIFQVFDGLQVTAAGALRGLKDTAFPMAITFGAYWGLGLPLGYLLGIKQECGAQGVWVGLIVGLAVAAVCLTARFHRTVSRRLKEGYSPLVESEGCGGYKLESRAPNVRNAPSSTEVECS
ncbi:MAG: MATE family efflux transporter [Planctomycetaceae bacterium]